MELVTNFESDKSLAEFYKEDELLGDLEDIVIMFGADPASQAVALEALRAYPGENLLSSCCKNCDCSLGWPLVLFGCLLLLVLFVVALMFAHCLFIVCYRSCKC
jgi:hypothetical protein